jgi:hypothetical protein
MLVPTFADRGCRLISAADPYGCILGFLDDVHFDIDNKIGRNPDEERVLVTDPNHMSAATECQQQLLQGC